MKREDLFQVHTYVANIMNEKDVRKFGFIYPARKNENKSNISKKIKIAGKEIDFEIRFLIIPEELSKESSEKESYFEKLKKNIDEFKIE